MNFETERLIIRKPKIEDAFDIFENYTQDIEVTKYLVWTPHKSIDDSKSWIDFCIKNAETESTNISVLELKQIKKVIGMIDFRIDKFISTFGYVLTKKYWNQGIMTEAMKPAIKNIFDRKDIFRIQAFHNVENISSGKVMLKLGMKLEGTLKRYSLHPNVSSIPSDVNIYSITK